MTCPSSSLFAIPQQEVFSDNHLPGRGDGLGAAPSVLKEARQLLAEILGLGNGEQALCWFEAGERLRYPCAATSPKVNPWEQALKEFLRCSARHRPMSTPYGARGRRRAGELDDGQRSGSAFRVRQALAEEATTAGDADRRAPAAATTYHNAQPRTAG